MGIGSLLSEGIFDIERLEERLLEIDQISADPSFWNQQEKAQTLLREQAGHKQTVGEWHRLDREVQDAKVLLELAEEVQAESEATEALRQAQHVARGRGIDQTVVPQPGGGVIGIALALVLLH